MPLEKALGRVLAVRHAARVSHPAADVSAMDGYAVRAEDAATVPVTLRVVGESAAGHPWSGAIKTGEAVRIFTGAYVPTGADAIVIQEDTDRRRPRRSDRQRGGPRPADTSAAPDRISVPATWACARHVA